MSQKQFVKKRKTNVDVADFKLDSRAVNLDGLPLDEKTPKISDYGENQSKSSPEKGTRGKRIFSDVDAVKFEKLVAKKKELTDKGIITVQDQQRLREGDDEIQKVAESVVALLRPKRVTLRYRQESLIKHRDLLDKVKAKPESATFGRCRTRDAEIARIQRVISKLETKLQSSHDKK